MASPTNLPTVTINSFGEVFFGGAEVTEVELAGLVRQALAESGQRTVVLRADQGVLHGQSVRIMDIIRQAGAERIAIATGG